MKNHIMISLENLSRYNENIQTVISDKANVEHNHDELYYIKSEVDELLSKFVSQDIVAQMIQQALNDYSNSNPETPDVPTEPDVPDEPDTPVEPEVPTENVGSITDDNSIVIDETQLENGIYTLRYIDSNDNIIDNFNIITSFEINK